MWLEPICFFRSFVLKPKLCFSTVSQFKEKNRRNNEVVACQVRDGLV